jgi:hypothetical protein
MIADDTLFTGFSLVLIIIIVVVLLYLFVWRRR